QGSFVTDGLCRQQRAHLRLIEGAFAVRLYRELGLCFEQASGEAAESASGLQRGVGAQRGPCVIRFHGGYWRKIAKSLFEYRIFSGSRQNVPFSAQIGRASCRE